MAIARDADVHRQFNASATSINWSHTCTGSKLILFVTTNSGSAIDSATYNSVSMTELNAITTDAGYLQLWYLLGPSTGANTVQINRTGSSFLEGRSASYTGVRQTGFPDASTTGTGTDDTFNMSLTTVADNCWMFGFSRNDGGNPTAGANTDILDPVDPASSGFDTNSAQTPAGSHTMSLSLAGANWWACWCSFAPDVPSTNNPNLLTLGVG